MKLQKLVALSTLVALSSTAVLTNVALAADGGEYKSTGVIEFTPDDGETHPVDPTDPTNPINPTDPDPENPGEPGGTQGPLSIDFASSLYFGKQKITSETKTYPAETQKGTDKEGKDVEVPNYVQVTDNRGLKNSGWTLQVQQMGQFKSADADELSAAAVTFSNAVVNSVSESERPTNVKEFTLNPDSTLQTVMSAKDGQGIGTTVDAFGTKENMANSINLNVPGSTTKYATKYATKYTTKFNWVLTDAPGQ